MKWPRWTIFILDAWFAAAPFALGYNGIKAAVSNGIVVGLAIAMFSIWYPRVEGVSAANWLSWGVFLLGLWLPLAPFFLGYHNVGIAGTCSILVGFGVIVLAWLQGATAEYTSRRHSEALNEKNNGTPAGQTVSFSNSRAKEATESSKRGLSEERNSPKNFWGTLASGYSSKNRTGTVPRPRWAIVHVGRKEVKRNERYKLDELRARSLVGRSAFRTAV